MMQIIMETFKRWRLPLVCFAWMFSLLGLLLRSGYKAFLVANFLPVIVLATAALAPMALFSLFRRNVPQFGIKEVLGTAILLLPLVYIHHAKGTTLGAGAFATRYVGSGIANSGVVSPGQETSNGDLTLLTLFMNPEKYDDREVTVVGMLMRDNPQVREILGVKRPILFRFAINCCAADAVPLAIILENNDIGALKDDDWIEVSGIFKIRKAAGQDLLVMENTTVVPAVQPATPYLSMVWGYF